MSARVCARERQQPPHTAAEVVPEAQGLRLLLTVPGLLDRQDERQLANDAALAPLPLHQPALRGHSSRRDKAPPNKDVCSLNVCAVQILDR